MPNERTHRRLAAILAADVVGYTRLMGNDEEGTRERLNEVFAEVVEPALEAHRGRLFKTMGDGFLAEFASVVDATDCAMTIQKDMHRRAADDDDPMHLRIGINLGDVIVEENEIHGDGVNVAARLEALAEPGGICISRSARDQIRDKLAYAIEDLGEVEVKNVARPVRVFRLADGPAEYSEITSPGPEGKRSTRVVAMALGAVAVLAAILFWAAPWSPQVEAASVERMKLPLPDKPSVAVLPFDVASSGEGDALFAEAVAEDLTRSLARISGLFVIARSSTLDYVGAKAVPARVAEDLGVQHVVRATVRRTGDGVRIDAELIDAISGRIIWSDRLERESTNLFELQDELVQILAIRLSADLGRMQEGPRFTESPEAFFLWARADATSWLNTPAAYGQARAMAQEALAIDPDFVRARSVLAFVDTQSGYFRVAEDPETALKRGLSEALAVVEMEPDDWYARSVLAQARMNMRDYEGADREYDRAIEMEPSRPNLLTNSVLPMIFMGRGSKAEARLQVAIRLNPFHNWLPNQLMGQSLYLQERYEEAADWLESARKKNPRFIGNMWWRAATYGQLGQEDKASEAFGEILARMPDVAISKSFIQISDAAAMERYRAGLRAAGMPE